MYSDEPDMLGHAPFVPSDPDVVARMLELASVGPKDTLYDLGSGDGRLLIAAVRDRGAKKAVGIEVATDLIEEAVDEIDWLGLSDRIEIRREDFFHANIQEATVISVYLLKTVLMDLSRRFLTELRPGTRIVSHAFDMGRWQPDEAIKIDYISLYLWIVPARLQGEWTNKSGMQFTCKQSYQRAQCEFSLPQHPQLASELELHGKILGTELTIELEAADQPQLIKDLIETTCTNKEVVQLCWRYEVDGNQRTLHPNNELTTALFPLPWIKERSF